MNECYYISTGALNCYYTLRYTFDELVRIYSNGAIAEEYTRTRDYYIQRLSIDKDTAIQKFKEITGNTTTVDFDLNDISKRNEIDHSIFQAGKHIGKSVHEVYNSDKNYLLWACENLFNTSGYKKTIELAKALISNLNKDLSDRKEAKEKEEKEAIAKADEIARILKPLSDILETMNSPFCKSIANDMKYGQVPRGKAHWIVCNIIAKTEGRANSKKYKAKYEEVNALLTSVTE